MNPNLTVEAPSQRHAALATDSFGNAIDPIVRYARGKILVSTDEEVQRMM